MVKIPLFPSYQQTQLFIKCIDGKKENFKKELYKLTPTKFENLIKDLLDAMGYEDVQVTAPTNDKGVDVVGSI